MRLRHVLCAALACALVLGGLAAAEIAAPRVLPPDMFRAMMTLGQSEAVPVAEPPAEAAAADDECEGWFPTLMADLRRALDEASAQADALSAKCCGGVWTIACDAQARAEADAGTLMEQIGEMYAHLGNQADAAAHEADVLINEEMSRLLRIFRTK